MVRMLPGGANRDTFVSLALSHCRNIQKRIRRRPNVFSFAAPNGLWRGRILPELEEQLESTRIAGSAGLRADALNPAPSKETDIPKREDRMKKTRKENEGTWLVAFRPPQRRRTRMPRRNAVVSIPTPWVNGYAPRNTQIRNNMALGARLVGSRCAGISIPMPDARFVAMPVIMVSTGL